MSIIAKSRLVLAAFTDFMVQSLTEQSSLVAEWQVPLE